MTKQRVTILVLNFFTRALYAPHVKAPGAIYHERLSYVSSVRRDEGMRALRLIDGRIRLRSYPLLDGPLRLHVEFGSITTPAAAGVQEEDCRFTAELIRENIKDQLVLCPLTLGHHLDHRTVQAAARQWCHRSCLASMRICPTRCGRATPISRHESHRSRKAHGTDFSRA